MNPQGMDPNQAPPHQLQRPQNPLANYQFSSDELRVLRECNTESFFQRSLPFGTGLGVATFFAIKNGYLKPNVRFGAIPKVVVSVIVGYFMGKFSYQQKCAEKIMRLPNSQLGEVLRQRKRGGVMGPDQSLSMGMALAPFTPTNADVYSDEHVRDPNRSTSLNLDVESRPIYSGLDDIYRPSLDNSSAIMEAELPIAAVKPGTSYEDLRKRNREEYAKKQQNPYSSPLPPDGPVVLRERARPAPQPSNDHGDGHKGKTNKYGDSWEN